MTKMLVTGVAVVLVHLIWISCSKRIHSIGGPYDIVFKRTIDCPPELRGREEVYGTLKEKRLLAQSNVHHYDANITLKFDLTRDIGAAAHLASWSNVAGWQSNAHIIKFPSLCFGIERMYVTLWNTIVRGVFGEYFGCPIPAGIYRLENVTLSGHVEKLKYFIYGRWRVDGQAVTRKGEVLGCSRSIIETVPLL